MHRAGPLERSDRDALVSSALPRAAGSPPGLRWVEIPARSHFLFLALLVRAAPAVIIAHRRRWHGCGGRMSVVEWRVMRLLCGGSISIGNANRGPHWREQRDSRMDKSCGIEQQSRTEQSRGRWRRRLPMRRIRRRTDEGCLLRPHSVDSSHCSSGLDSGPSDALWSHTRHQQLTRCAHAELCLWMWMRMGTRRQCGTQPILNLL